MVAGSIAAFCGTAMYGPASLWILAVASVSAVAADVAYSLSARCRIAGGLSHALLIGFLLGLTLPPTVPWHVAAVGSAVAICVKGVFGGMGHCLWHPTLVGRVVVQFVYWPVLSLAPSMPAVQGPILARDSLFQGDLTRAVVISTDDYHGWRAANAEWPDAVAFRVDRPIVRLRAFSDGTIDVDGELAVSTLVRDVLPPWEDTVLGTVPGGIGETCAIGLIVAGLYLIYRGHLRWQLPASILAAAALAAAVLPIQTPDPGGGYRWIPALAFEDDRHVGLAYVLYHLTSGQLMIGAFLLGGDMMLTPMRAKGQVVFGVGVGVLTIFLRLYGPLDGACYWAILAMNTLVPAIDRRLKRPIVGLAN